MYTKWTSNLPKDKKHEFQSNVAASQVVLKRMREVLAEDLDSCIKHQESKDYTESAWPYFQADCVGETRAYKTVLKYLDNLISK